MEDGKVKYSSIVSVEGNTKDELYARARLWLPEAFKDSRDAIQVDDKENGLLLGKGRPWCGRPDSVVAAFGEDLVVHVENSDQGGPFKIDLYDINYSFFQPGAGMPRYDMVFDDYYSDESNFKKDGTIKRRAARNIATGAANLFAGLSADLEKVMRQQVSKDDF
ncbi:MAG: DUF4468 domain-containing protein [Dokdonella sp.]